MPDKWEKKKKGSSDYRPATRIEIKALTRIRNPIL